MIQSAVKIKLKTKFKYNYDQQNEANSRLHNTIKKIHIFFLYSSTGFTTTRINNTRSHVTPPLCGFDYKGTVKTRPTGRTDLNYPNNQGKLTCTYRCPDLNHPDK